MIIEEVPLFKAIDRLKQAIKAYKKTKLPEDSDRIEVYRQHVNNGIKKLKDDQQKELPKE